MRFLVLGLFSVSHVSTGWLTGIMWLLCRTDTSTVLCRYCIILLLADHPLHLGCDNWHLVAIRALLIYPESVLSPLEDYLSQASIIMDWTCSLLRLLMRVNLRLVSPIWLGVKKISELYVSFLLIVQWMRIVPRQGLGMVASTWRSRFSGFLVFLISNCILCSKYQCYFNLCERTFRSSNIVMSIVLHWITF